MDGRDDYKISMKGDDLMSRNKLPKILSRSEVERLLAIPNPRYPTGLRNRVMLQLFYRAGLRRQEVIDLVPADIDYTNNLLYIQDSKGGKDRVVPFDDETKSWLEKWKERRPESDYFFCTLPGNKLSPRYVLEMVYRASEKAQVFVQNGRTRKKVHPHIFRHTYATELLEEGFGIHEVQQLLGHSNITTTAV
ncbi:MAG: tyrosine-type recombinase/integrase, partial [Firmicutes bacterium]|nr:tyrosine-type recombinase/integrase [Bacillota bacterium]